MSKIAIFLISASFAGWVLGAVPALPSGAGGPRARRDAKTTAETPLLRDGFVLNGAEGKLVGPDSNDVWFFEFGSDVNDYPAVVKVGTRLELLPSSALGRMIADAGKDSALTYRLWGARVTKYKGRNFIFPNYFLPLSRAEQSQPQDDIEQAGAESEPQPTLEGELTDSNSVLSIPPEILKKLRARRQKIADVGQRISDSNTASVDELKQTAATGDFPDVERYTQSADSVLVDRTGLLVSQPRKGRLSADDSRLVFVPDALGRNVGSALGTLRLLPCEILELTELKQAGQLEQVRFRIAGITTEYEGKRYLLLQTAAEVYSHGNFGR
ncbi:MAG: hypothetical protein ABIF19_11925 [Planctomycetota bacterium]